LVLQVRQRKMDKVKGDESKVRHLRARGEADVVGCTGSGDGHTAWRT